MKKFLKLLASLAALAVCAYLIYYSSMNFIKIRHETLTIDGLPDGISGLKILQITDLHSQSSDEMSLDIWQAVNAQEFDICVITGDFISSALGQVYPHIDALEKLAKEKPVYFVDGNHERYVYAEISTIMSDAGVTVLNNERVTHEYNGASFEIIGIRDRYYLRSNGYDEADAAMIGENSGFQLLLSHQPLMFERIKDQSLGIELMLSGHVHGGQIRLPFLPTLFSPDEGFFPEYGDGWYEEAGLKMYISRGIGATSAFPVRFFNRPEITVFELK